MTGVISGPFSLTATAASSLYSEVNLTGNNTFSGGLSVLNGTLEVPAPNIANAAGPLGMNTGVTLGAAYNQTGTMLIDNTSTSNMPFTLAGGGTGVFNTGPNSTTPTVTLTGLISGDGDLGKTGRGTLVLANANTYAGGTTISGGVLRVTNQTGSATGSGPVVVGGGGVLAGSASPGQGFVAGPVTLATATVVGSTSAGGGISAYGGAVLTIGGGLTLQNDTTSTIGLTVPNGNSNAMVNVLGPLQASGTHTVSFTAGWCCNWANTI